MPKEAPLFVSFMSDPRAFLDTTIVRPPVRGAAWFESGVCRYVIRKEPGSVGVNLATGLACDVVKIEPADSSNSDYYRFDSYFCAYDDDKTFSLVISDDANLMLTAAMNGCSFGVGSETPSHARLVSHANVSRTSDTAEGILGQEAAEAGRLADVLVDGGAVIGSSRYLTNGATCGTTVGVRGSDGKWSFCTQSWRVIGSNFTLLDVHDFA